MVFDGRTVRVRDLKGIRYLAQLLANPGREIHVLDLVAGETGKPMALGDAGEMLDERAKSAYRRRLGEIEDDIEQARALEDAVREAQADTERDFLVRELARAVGLGGRDRRATSASERARSGVIRAVRQGIAGIANTIPRSGSISTKPFAQAPIAPMCRIPAPRWYGRCDVYRHAAAASLAPRCSYSSKATLTDRLSAPMERWISGDALAQSSEGDHAGVPVLRIGRRARPSPRRAASRRSMVAAVEVRRAGVMSFSLGPTEVGQSLLAHSRHVGAALRSHGVALLLWHARLVEPEAESLSPAEHQQPPLFARSYAHARVAVQCSRLRAIAAYRVSLTEVRDESVHTVAGLPWVDRSERLCAMALAAGAGEEAA